MKATPSDFAKKAAQTAGKCQLYFLCGPDEAGASAAAAKLIASLPDPGERVDLGSADLRGNPVRLVDEARSTSLFGDTRHLWVRVNGEEAHDALATFCKLADMGETQGAWPVVVIATGATDKSRSAKLLTDRKDALVVMFYPPTLASVAAEVRIMADAAGVRLGGDLAERIARGAGLDVRLAQSEIDKLALYLDASPLSPKPADRGTLDLIGAQTEDDGFAPVVKAVLSGDLKALPRELARVQELGISPVGIALALERRAAQLAGLAARLQPGMDIARLLEAERVFFRERDEIGRQLAAWRGPKLERLVQRLTALHRNLMDHHAMGELLLRRELAEIARAAAHRR